MNNYIVVIGTFIYGLMLLSFYSFFIRIFLNKHKAIKPKKKKEAPK